jgi:peptide chain release factor 1
LVREHTRLKRIEVRAAEFFGLERRIAENEEVAAGTDEELAELARTELEPLRAALPSARQELTLALLPPDPAEARNAVLEIRAGTGGDEAALFAADLVRMYTRHCQGRGWKTTLVDASSSDIGGYKDATLMVEGEGAYGVLQFESGGHRVQRVPVTEASGRIHTSAATVVALPEAEEEDEIAIPPEEIRVDIFCSGGPGGQGVNTTYSAVRVTHLPTGVVAQCQDERSQHRNKEKAMKVLQARLLDRRRQEEAARMGSKRKRLAGSGDRSERIRTYNFPQNRMTDHRINLTLYSLDRVMLGEIGELLEALRHQDIELRLAAETAEGA